MNRRRCARSSPLFVAFIGTGVLLAGLIAWLAIDRRKSGGTHETLIVYCAASVRTPVETIAKDYERATGTRVELQYGASQSLLTNAAVSHKGDLYLPADDSYIAQAREKGLIGEAFPLGAQHPVLAVKKGNPKAIRSLDDLLRPDVKLAQANPDAAAIGKLTRELLTKTGQWEALRVHTSVFTGNVTEAANALALGTVDAAFMYDAMATQYPDLELIRLPVLAGAESKLVVAELKSSGRPEEAAKFARYLADRQTGLPYFKKFGFTVDEGGAR